MEGRRGWCTFLELSILYMIFLGIPVDIAREVTLQ